MPMCKIISSKDDPRKGIHYVTRKDKAIRVGSLNMFGKTEDEFVDEFRANTEYFHKERREDSRTYYHCILSPDPKDGISPDNMLDYAGDVAEEFFPDSQCVIGVHRDNGIVHGHIIVNASNVVNGNKLQINAAKYGAMKDKANELGAKYGLTPVDFRKKPDVKISSAERRVLDKYGTSKNMVLRKIIDDAKNEAYDERDFIDFVKENNVEITRVGKDYSFMTPGAKKAIRGGSLGALYTREYITGWLENQQDEYEEEMYGDETYARSTKFTDDFLKGELRRGAGYDELYDNYQNVLAFYSRQPGYDPDLLSPAGASETSIKQGMKYAALETYSVQSAEYEFKDIKKVQEEIGRKYEEAHRKIEAEERDLERRREAEEEERRQRLEAEAEERRKRTGAEERERQKKAAEEGKKKAAANASFFDDDEDVDWAHLFDPDRKEKKPEKKPTSKDDDYDYKFLSK